MTEKEPTGALSVIGAGAWGTALAIHAARIGHDVTLWAYEQEVVASIEQRRTNDAFLPGFTLPPNVRATGDLADAVAASPVVLSVVPSHVVRTIWEQAAPALAPDAIVVSASKGIEEDSVKAMHTVIGEAVPGLGADRFACLSGPSFAKEVAADKPTAIVVASTEPTATRVQRLLSGPTFRVYTTHDVVGTEMGGALKNVMAIAVGASDGLGLGANARAGLITRGLAEITRAAVAAGADPLTLAGLAGVGDLVLTCTGDLSRNRGVGKALGEGRTREEIVDGMRMVAEGIKTTRSAHQLGARLGVEMPITAHVHAMLYEGLPAREAVARLMARSLKAENEFVRP